MKDYDAIVAEGAQILDDDPRVPDGWRSMIDIERMSIQSAQSCILGQLFGNWHDAPSFAVGPAFCPNLKGPMDEYRDDVNGLNDAWRRYLRPVSVDA